MPRSIPAPIRLLLLLALAVTPVVAQTDRQSPPSFSVDSGLAPEQTDEARISELNQKIMEMQARGETGPALADLLNDLGVVHAQREEWAPARDAFIRAVQAKPYDPDFHRNLALVFLRLEDYELAISELQAYRDSGGPAALDAYRLLGNAHLKAGDPAAARQAYSDGLEALGRAPSAEVCRLALLLAGLEKDQGDSQAERRTLETWLPHAQKWQELAAADQSLDGLAEAEAIENNLLILYIQDGQILEDSGMYVEAAELYERAYQMAPDRDELLPRIAGAWLASGDALKARVTARLGRQDHPDRPGAWLATAKVYEGEERLQEALDAYVKAYEIAPDTPGLRLKVGNLYMKLGQAAEGRKYLVEAIQAPDTPTEVVFNYGLSLMREKKFAAATAPLKRVTREAPEFAGGWLALAQCYHSRKMYTQAVPAYQQALALQPDAKTAYNLGVSAGRAKQWDTAVAAYDQALELAPENTEPAYNRAVALMQAGRLEEAEQAFAAYLAQDPQHYKANLNHGVVLYKLDRFQEAVDAYNLVLEIKETAEAWDNMGLAYKALGREKRAQQCFKEAKKMRGEA